MTGDVGQEESILMSGLFEDYIRHLHVRLSAACGETI